MWKEEPTKHQEARDIRNEKKATIIQSEISPNVYEMRDICVSCLWRRGVTVRKDNRWNGWKGSVSPGTIMESP